MEDDIERRKFQRRKITWPVKIHTPQGDFSGETVTVSEAGISFCFEGPLAVKKNLQITIMPPGHDAIRVSGEVIWSDLFGIDDTGDVVGFGIFFIQISEEDRRYLREIVFDA